MDSPFRLQEGEGIVVIVDQIVIAIPPLRSSIILMQHRDRGTHHMWMRVTVWKVSARLYRGGNTADGELTDQSLRRPPALTTGRGPMYHAVSQASNHMETEREHSPAPCGMRNPSGTGGSTAMSGCPSARTICSVVPVARSEWKKPLWRLLLEIGGGTHPRARKELMRTAP